MPKTPRVDNDDLLRAGLELMRAEGKPLSPVDSRGRSMKYALADGQTVRVRTSNDHVLIVLADRAAEDAKLNIEETDWLLLVMPEVERTPGPVVAYLVPTQEAVDAARRSHREWLATNPNTKGNNRTWNLWFCNKKGVSKPYNDFATKWSQYRLNGHNAGPQPVVPLQNVSIESGSVKAEVEAARQRISKAAGVPVDAVRITIQFGA
jgi:hypothetical protein